MPGVDLVKAFDKYETHHSKESNKIVGKTEQLVNQMETLQAFLSAIANSTDQTMRIDWSQDPEKRALVDSVRAVDPSLIDQGVYSWKDKQIENLSERFNNHINRLLSPQVSHQQTLLTQKHYEMNEVLSVMTTILKDLKALIDRIQGNIQRAHG